MTPGCNGLAGVMRSSGDSGTNTAGASFTVTALTSGPIESSVKVLRAWVGAMVSVTEPDSCSVARSNKRSMS